MTTAPASQCDRLLARLVASRGQWVPMPELARACSPSDTGIGICVSRRIYDLRRRGNTIECRDEKQHDGQRHTSYRLAIPAIRLEPISPAAPVATEPAAASQTDLPLTECGENKEETT